MLKVTQPEFKKKFSESLRILRIDKGLNQRQLADRAGLHYSTISYYESGSTLPDLFSFVSLAKALGVESSALIDFEL